MTAQSVHKGAFARNPLPIDSDSREGRTALNKPIDADRTARIKEVMRLLHVALKYCERLLDDEVAAEQVRRTGQDNAPR